jgi:hypothetical protein
MSTNLFGGTDWVALAFGAFNAIKALSYLHQINTLTRHAHCARAVLLSCWAIWVGANAATTLHATFSFADISLTMVSSFSGVSCAIVLVVMTIKQYFNRRDTRHDSSVQRLVL